MKGMSLEITEELIARQTPEAQAIIRALLATIRQLQDQLNQSPRNSSLPPSTEHPHAKPPRPKSPAARRRGGQPGHPRHERPLLPTEQCNDVIPLKPVTCRRCGRELSGQDAAPLRHQVWELPLICFTALPLARRRWAGAGAFLTPWYVILFDHLPASPGPVCCPSSIAASRVRSAGDSPSSAAARAASGSACSDFPSLVQTPVQIVGSVVASCCLFATCVVASPEWGSAEQVTRVTCRKCLPAFNLHNLASGRVFFRRRVSSRNFPLANSLNRPSRAWLSLRRAYPRPDIGSTCRPPFRSTTYRGVSNRSRCAGER